MFQKTTRSFLAISFCTVGLLACSEGGGGDGPGPDGPGGDGPDGPVGVVQGKLGAPPIDIPGGLRLANGVGYGQSRQGLAVEELTILFTHETTQQEVEAQPAADGTISVSLGIGTWIVTIKLPEEDVFSQVTSYSTETKLEITQEMIDNGTPASFFLPRVMQQRMPGNGISAACGYKIDVDEATGDFVALSDRALWAGNIRAPHEASAYYTLDRDFLQPAQVALHDGRAFVLWGNKIRGYDVSTSSIAANQAIDCTDAHCFEERAVDGPTFTVAAGACPFGSMDRGSEFDNFKDNLGAGNPGGGGGDDGGGDDGGDGNEEDPDVNIAGENFKQDYVSYFDQDTDTVIMSFGNYASFFDANTLEQKRSVTIGRFLDDCGSKYLFVLENNDEHHLKIVDPATFSAETVNLNGEIPTLVEVVNATTDATTGLTYLSFGGLASDATVGGIATLDCSETDVVQDVQPAQTFFGLSDHLPPGPIQVTNSGRVMYGDSLFERSGSGFDVLATHMLSQIELSGLSISENQFKENAPQAGIVFSYGASSALGVAWAGESQVLGFAVRVSLHDLVHVVNIPGFGAIAIDEKGNMSTIYYNIPDGMDQPPESVDLGEVTQELDETYHPACGGEPFVACPDSGICIVADGGFTNDTGECVPNPDGSFCGGADDVRCPDGTTCREDADRGFGYCVPNFDCEPNGGKNCAAGMGCFDLGTLKRDGGDFCYVDEATGAEVCCYPIPTSCPADDITCRDGTEPREFECCGPDGCERTSDIPEVSPYQCIPAAPEGPGLCGGFDNLGCPDNRPCVTGFDFFPEDTGLCEARAGEYCHISDQCQGDLICNPLTSRCEAPCETSGDCAAGVCTFQGGDFGYVCDRGFPETCGPGEIGVWFDGARCTTEKPCDPWGFSGTGCGEDEACVESHDPDTGAWGAYCRPSCDVSSDCSGPDEICLADWSGERSCVVADDVPDHCAFCDAGTYCHQNGGPDGRGCYSAETPPCSNRQGEGTCDSAGLTCNWNMGGICVAECSGKSDCASGQNCKVVDPWQGTSACITPTPGELECSEGHLSFEGACAILPTGGCTFGGVGCAAGYQCAEGRYGNGQDICLCEDIATCTVCSNDSGCPNGASCNLETSACVWNACPNGQEDCPPDELCADWLGGDQNFSQDFQQNYPRDVALCVDPGPGNTGDACRAHADCASFLCDSGACLRVCDTTADCADFGLTCVAGDPWAGQNYRYCATVAAGTCALDEVYYPQHQNGPQCSRYAQCIFGPNGPECDQGFVCNQNGGNECRPECETTADCASGQNCRTQNMWINNQDTVVSFCDDPSSCNDQQCAADEKCIDGPFGPTCSDLEPCGSNGSCGAGFACDFNTNFCTPACLSNADCTEPGEQCLLDPFSGATEGRCRIPEPFDNCACPSGLACVQGRGTCVDLTTTGCSSTDECANVADYSCERLDGSPQAPAVCICLNSNSAECFDCAGDHGLCQSNGGVCGASGLCETVSCSPLETPSVCPTGTSCIEDQFNFPPRWSCAVPSASRADGQTCNWGGECASGLCRNGTCRSPCASTQDCVSGNCDRQPNEQFGACQSPSACAISCPSTDICLPSANVCETPCRFTSDCNAGENCERFPQDESGICRPDTGPCQLACAANQYCDPGSSLCR